MIIYLRASYVLLDNAAVIKVSQDISYTANNQERYVLYFFSPPQPTSNYTIYRAIVDYDATTEETRVLILAFDLYIQNNELVGNAVQSTEKTLSEAQNWDVDIAYGYETINLSAAESDHNVKTIVTQIGSRYSELIKNKTLQSIEVLELKTGKLNYKIVYLNPVTHLTVKFIVYYDPTLKKVLLLNTVNLPSSQQFQELSDSEKTNDPVLK